MGWRAEGQLLIWDGWRLWWRLGAIVFLLLSVLSWHGVFGSSSVLWPGAAAFCTFLGFPVWHIRVLAAGVMWFRMWNETSYIDDSSEDK